MKKVIVSDGNVEQMTWSDAWRIAIIAGRSRRRYFQEIGCELRPGTGVGQADSGRGTDSVAAEPGLKLLIGSEAAARKVHVTASSGGDRYCARDQPAVIAPVEAHPRPGLPGLVSQVRGLVELFVVIDAEWEDIRSASSRRNRAGSSSGNGWISLPRNSLKARTLPKGTFIF